VTKTFKQFVIVVDSYAVMTVDNISVMCCNF